MMATTQPTAANALAEQLARQLDSLPASPLRFEDPAALAPPIAELQRLHDEIERASLDDDELQQTVAERLKAFQGRRERLNLIAEARLEVDRRLARAQQMFADGAMVEQVAQSYRAAESYVTSLLGERDWELDEREVLSALAGKAEQTREAFLNDHERPTTRQQGQDVADLIVSWIELSRKNPDYVVTYFNAPAIGSPMAKIPVSEALRYARGILFKLWDDKINEYLENARQRLDIDHQPGEALAEWQRCERLPGRENPDLGVELSDDLIRAINKMRGRIDEAIKARNLADTELRRADNALLPPHRDALTAESHRLKAEAHDLYIPGLDECRLRIVAAATAELPSLVATIEGYVRSEAITQAATSLIRADQLLALLPEYALPDERARLSVLHNVAAAAAPLFQQDNRLPLQKQRELLDQLAIQYGDSYWPGWTSLASRRSRLHTLNQLDALEKQIDEACKLKGDTLKLEELSQALTELIANPPADAPADKAARLPEQLARVNAWLGYALARDELNRVPKPNRKEAPTLLPDELDDDDVADLRVAEEGLTMAEAHASLRAAGPIAAAMRDLRRTLDTLKENDKTAERALRAARLTLDGGSPDAEELRARLNTLQQELNKPSSFRQELFTTAHEARAQLLTLRHRALQALLGKGRADYYQGLNEGGLELQREVIRQLWRGKAEDDPAYNALAAEVALARAIARARRLEGQAGQDSTAWRKVQQAWETAREKAPDDSDAYSYTHSRSRQAFKQVRFVDSTRSRPETAAELLKSLTEDAALGADWEVWYRYGRAVFALARLQVDPNQKFSDNLNSVDNARNNLEEARNAFRRAHDLLQGHALEDGASIEARNDLNAQAIAAERWAFVLRAMVSYRDNLRGQWPTNGECLRIATTHEDTLTRLRETPRTGRDANLPDAEDSYNALWKQTGNVALGRLTDRLETLPAGQILDRLDVLFGLALLFPDNGGVQTQLSNEALQILAALQELVANTVKDYSGAAFSQRYFAREKKSAAEEDSLALQIDEARQTALSLQQYEQTLQRIGPNTLRIQPQQIINQIEQVQNWVDELEQFRDALENAGQLAKDGLNDPHQFARAQRILRLAQTQYTELTQVPIEFVNANHPTYRWVTGEILADMALRQEQEHLKNEIEQQVRDEAQAVAFAFRWRAGDALTPPERTAVEQLPQVLNRLRGLLRQMIDQAPNDPTLLQQGTVYRPPEAPHDPVMERRGATNVEKAVAEKLAQYTQVEGWLAQWSEGTELRHIVDWNRIRSRLGAWRDSGPEGLKKALQGNRSARLGDGQGKHDGLWALRPAYEALSDASLNRVIGAAAAEGSRGWFGLIEPLNQRRLVLRQRLAAQIDDAERMETDILRRISLYQVRMDQLQNRRAALFNARKMPWKQWADLPEWLSFEQAVYEFCAICPKDPTFIGLCEDVTSLTGQAIYCPAEPERPPL